MLGQWLYYKEERSDCLNLFDSRLGARRLRLLRLALLNVAYQRAKRESTVEVPVTDYVSLFTHGGASFGQILSALEALGKYGLIRNVSAEAFGPESSVVITRAGGYYLTGLTRKLVYVEACLYDTAIEDSEAWDEIVDLSMAVMSEPSPVERLKLRRQRMRCFMAYLMKLEEMMFADIPGSESMMIMSTIKDDVAVDARRAVRSARRSAERWGRQGDS